MCIFTNLKGINYREIGDRFGVSASAAYEKVNTSGTDENLFRLVPGGTPINRVYGDDPLDRVWFLGLNVIDRVSILRFVSSRFEFLVIDRVLLLLTGLGCKQHWSLFHRLINKTLEKNVSRAFAAFLKSSLSGPKIKTMKQGRVILGLSYTGVQNHIHCHKQGWKIKVFLSYSG